ncbi:hypothetical protein CLOM_g4738 [Closterium sp. NIES-68]|nr:hypothetical protein CLOM_g4738 [Closterium sp. NIES-68]GJP74676.1 hypothetical protein CLOP_g5228 [Closterium sp. NIES-67]GJP75465.1 hypothetical protein CLOP_g5909 [Closterium sp. NIES-67]GJP80777.1 hypothetical protein CLOP_g10979 [Closterium sp. NIES-67]
MAARLSLQQPTTPQSAYTRFETLDLYPSADVNEPQLALDFYASDALFARHSRPPVRPSCSAQALHAIPSAASCGSSAALRCGGNTAPSARRRALSASECGRILSPSPPRANKPATCAFRRRRHQLTLSKLSPSKVAATQRSGSNPGSSFNFSPEDDKRATSRVFARSNAYSTPVTVVRSRLANQADPYTQMVGSHAEASSSRTESELHQADRAMAAAHPARTPSCDEESAAARGCMPFLVRGRRAMRGRQPGSSGSRGSSARPSSAPSSPRSPGACSSSSTTTTTSGDCCSRRAATGNSQLVKPCLTAPSSTTTTTSNPEEGSPRRSPRRVNFVRYVEVLEYVA